MSLLLTVTCSYKSSGSQNDEAGARDAAPTRPNDASMDARIDATLPMNPKDATSGKDQWVKADWLPTECSVERWTGTETPPELPPWHWEPCADTPDCQRLKFDTEDGPGYSLGIDPYWAKANGTSYFVVRKGEERGNKRAMYDLQGNLVLAWRVHYEQGAECITAYLLARGEETGSVALYFADNDRFHDLISIVPTASFGQPVQPTLRIDTSPAGAATGAYDWDFSVQAMAFKYPTDELLVVSRSDARRWALTGTDVRGSLSEVKLIGEMMYWTDWSDRVRLRRANLDGCLEIIRDIVGKDSKGLGTGPTHLSWIEGPANSPESPARVMLAESTPCGVPLAPIVVADTGRNTAQVLVGAGVLAYYDRSDPPSVRVVDFEQQRQLLIDLPAILDTVSGPLYVDRDDLVLNFGLHGNGSLPNEPWRIDLSARAWEPWAPLP